MEKKYLNNFGEVIKIDNKGRFTKGFKHNNKRKKQIGVDSKKWHKENKNTEKYKIRGERISKGKTGVLRKDLIENKFSIGNKPNKTSFKKGMVPWNKGTKGKMGKVWNEGLTKETSNKVRDVALKHSKTKRERLAKGLIKYPSGENSHSWLGGKSFEPYNYKFNKEFKNLVRLRDNFCCMNCGISEQKSILLRNRKLSIHHIDYDKLNTCLMNCITLCATCNNKSNFNRNYWTNYFQSLLNEKYNYQYKLLIECIL